MMKKYRYERTFTQSSGQQQFLSDKKIILFMRFLKVFAFLIVLITVWLVYYLYTYQMKKITYRHKQGQNHIQFQKTSDFNQKNLEFQENKVKNQGNFEWDTSIQYAKHFKIQGRKIIRNLDDRRFYQITSLHPLPLQSTTVFRLLTYGRPASYIFFGIITQKRKQQQFSGYYGPDQTQSIGYKTGANSPRLQLAKIGLGAINIDGKQQVKGDESLFVPQGGLLTMQVDLSVPKITFINQLNNTVRTHNLAKHFQQQNVYVYATTIFPKDSIEIIQE